MATLTTSYQYLGRSNKMAPQSGSYGYYVLLYAKSVPNNSTGYHTVTIKEVLACTINSSFYQYGTSYSGSINGAIAFSGKKKPSAAWELGSFTEGGTTYKVGTVIAEGNLQVDCTDGQAKTIPLSCSLQITVATSATFVPAKGTTGTASVNATLPAIARASTITATDSYIESTSSVIFARKNSTYTHTLEYKADGQTAYSTIFTKQDVTAYGWQVPTDLYSLIPSSRSVQVTLRCTTYTSSGTVVGSPTYCTMTASTSESKCAPEVSVTAEETDAAIIALTGSNKKLIKGYGTVQITTTATIKNSATLGSISVICGAKTGTGAVATIAAPETSTIKSTVTDSRAYTTTKTASGMSMIEYTPLTANATAARAGDTSGNVTVTCTGNFFNSTLGAVKNTLSVQVRYKLQSATEYTVAYADMTVTIGWQYSATITLTGLSYNQAYTIQVKATDKLTAVISEAPISKAIPLFDWGEEDFKFNIPVNVDGALEGSTVKSRGALTGASASVTGAAAVGSLSVGGQSVYDYVISDSTSNSWRIRKWKSGFCELWKRVTVTVAISTAWNGLYIKDDAIPNQTFPVTFAAIPMVIATPSLAGGQRFGLMTGSGDTATTRPSTTGTGSYGVWRTNNQSQCTVGVFFYVSGTLK